jgi:hypothetical protein
LFSIVRLAAACAVLALAGSLVLSHVSTNPQADPVPAAAVGPDTSEPWDLVWFSDSTGFFVAQQWADTIEEALGVEVRVHDYAEGSLKAVQVLRSLEAPTGGYQRLGDLRGVVADAEIVVVYGNPWDSGSTDDLDICVSESRTPRDPPTRYAAEHFAPFRQTIESIYERVFDLVGDRPVIVRAIDFYNPVISDWRIAGVEAACTAAWEAYSDTLRDAAAGFGVPLVSMYDAFNGPDHTEDPREKGYISSDRVHTSAAGREAMVAALHAAGYEPTQR